MKTKPLFSIFIFLIVSNCYAQTSFQKIIRAGQSTVAYSGQQTTDGGYIITGLISGTDSNGVYLVKTNSNGDVLWTKIYSGEGAGLGRSVQQTTDGGYIIAGSCNVTAEPIGLYVIKTDSAGDTLWTKNYGGLYDGEDVANSVQQTYDGGYIITGQNTIDAQNDLDVCLIKINASGDITWSKNYGDSLTNRQSIAGGLCGKQTSDSGYVITGFIRQANSNITNVYLIKTNPIGDTIWTKTYDTNGGGGSSVQQTVDGGYFIAGATDSYGAGGTDVYLIKTNAFGDTLWTKTYGTIHEDAALFGQPTTDGGYIASGYWNDSGTGDRNIFLIKIDSNGDTLWTKTYGGVGETDVGSVQQTNDGGYIIAGYTNGYGGGAIYLIKTDANGNSGGCYQGTTSAIVGSPHTQVLGSNTVISAGVTANFATTIVGSGGDDSTLCFSSVIIPISNFLASDSLLCANDCISFTNLSINATSWQWSFAGAIDSTSLAENPTNICYANAGNFNVTLVAKDSAGGSNSLTIHNYITVNPAPPTPVITQSNDTLYCSTDPTYTSYQWYFDTTLIVGATDTFLVITLNANYNLRVTNANGCIIAVGTNITTGINAFSANNYISLSPNPAINQLTIHTSSFATEVITVSVINMLDQTVFQSSNFNLQSSIDVSSLSSGIYFVRIANEKELWTGKFVKE